MSAGIQGLPPPPAAAHITVFRAKDPDYVAVFVEGPDDVETWKPWLKWRPFPAGGCGPVRAAVESLRAAGESGYVGIIDADCERLEGCEHEAADLIITEHHDLECDLVNTGALERLIGSVDDDVLAGALAGQSIREALVARALPFGLVRWHFFRIGRMYEDGRLSPHRFVNHRTWVLDETALLTEAAAVLGQPLAQLSADVAALRQLSIAPWHVCNGHDVLSILTIALRGILGLGSTHPHVKSVSTALRLAVDSAHREALHVWRALQAWQGKNHPWTACKP